MDATIAGVASNAVASMQKSAAVTAVPGMDMAAAKKAAQSFESVFITQMLNGMFEGVSTDGMFGGGAGESMFRSMMIDQFGQKIAAQGGFGLSDSVMGAMIRMQQGHA